VAGFDSGSEGAPALLSRLAAPKAELMRANASWRPNTPSLRVEIMASGSFEKLRGIRSAVNRLQDSLVGATGRGAIELRLTEVRRTCRHVTAWSGSPVDPGAATTEWECLEEALSEEPESRTLFAQAFRDSVGNRVNHVVLFGDSFDDGFLSLNMAVRSFRQHGIRVSTFYLGDDFNGRNRYRFLAAGTGGLFLALPATARHGADLDAAALAIVAAFACGDHARLSALPTATPEAKALMAQARRR
jgi:hypothetical protein